MRTKEMINVWRSFWLINKFLSTLYNRICTERIYTETSDLHLISSYNITGESNIKVMRTKEMINVWRSFWLINKFLSTLYNRICTERIYTETSDLHLISSYNITGESNIKVMRIKEMINTWRSPWLINQFLLTIQ